MTRVASIGSTHPQDAAGLAIDVRVALDYQIEHATVLAGITVQNGTAQLFPVTRRVLEAQLAALPSVHVYRVGALLSAGNARAVADFLRAKRVLAVIDPVLFSSTGAQLFEDAAYIEALRNLSTLPAVVTPNLQEASALCEFEVTDPATMEAAGKALVKSGAAAALIKGGHLEGEPVDVFVSPQTSRIFGGTRLDRKLRGTGCRLAAALACELARGSEIFAAVESARQYVRNAIEKDGA